MTKEKLKMLLCNPDQTGQAIDDLQRLVDTYPYFHAGHQLFLKGLWQTDEKKMAFQLKKTALCVRNRDVLYHYINQSSPQINIHHTPIEPPQPEKEKPPQPEEEKHPLPEDFTSTVDTTKNVVDTTPVEIREIYSESQLIADLIKTSHVQNDRTDIQKIPAKDETKGNISSSTEKRAWSSSELIEFFLNSNPKIVPNDRQYTVDLSDSMHDNQEIVTETLADIYATQGHKDKAIEIYQQLILKYPEKHIYFAAQIERFKE
jgi:tetratricopeptide (TPR) repeat protein